MRLASPGVSSWFERGARIVLPSPLLASVTAHQFARYQLNRGLDSWLPPGIQSLDAWLSACWYEARYVESEIPALLSQVQERFLWQQIIQREHSHLFDIGATAALVQRAARTASEWLIAIDADPWNDNVDAQQFQRWYKQFRRRCRDERWIARWDLWHVIPKWFASGVCERKPTVFARFEALPPSLAHVQRALADFAVVEPTCHETAKRRAQAKEFASFEEEIESAARSARAMFEEQPGCSVGVFVTDLASRRTFVERTFQQVFYPRETAHIGPFDSTDSAFHLNAAPLTDHPLIASALLIQGLVRPRIPIAEAGAILRCPFLKASAAERSVRALGELELRRKRELDVTIADLQYASKNSPLLQGIWMAVRRVLRAVPHGRHEEFPYWSKLAADLLEAVGWPGEEPLNSREEEMLEAWKDGLSALATLGLVSGPVSFETAMSQLRRILSGPGPARGDWSSPVQILDASDAPGLRFDSAIVTGLSEDSWPPLVNASPLIPLTLQRSHNVPGTSPDRVQRQREDATRELLAVAPEVTATYSGRISPSLEQCVIKRITSLPQWQGKMPRQSYVPLSLDSIEDTNAPPYREGRPRGGTSLIKLQSLCPFRAFAERRLNAIMPEEGAFGFDNLERGKFLHNALEEIWKRLQTQDRLKEIRPEDLHSLIDEVVVEVVRCNGGGPLHEQAAQAERIRLRQVIGDWLRVERERKQPFTVQTTEEERVYEVEGLRLKLRIDRIDRLSNGKLLLIDYKSGEPSASHLDKERPREPQLLVYAAAVGNEIDGMFFAQLKPRDARLVGYSRQLQTIDRKSKVIKSWYEYLQDRRSKVEELARGFAAGEAAVDPVNGACEYCQIKPFCRLNERIRQQEDTE